MPSLLFLLPMATAIALLFLYFFFWSVKNGEFEDPEKIKYKILFDNDDDVASDFSSTKGSGNNSIIVNSEAKKKEQAENSVRSGRKRKN